MLLSYFLPLYWKSKLLFAQKVLSVSIRDGFFIACLSIVSKTKTTLLNVEKVLLPENTDASQNPETQTDCIKKTIAKIGKYNQLVVTQSSENIIFKELEFSFATRSQLELVLYEELEPQLPFNPDEAYTGFVINEVRADGTSNSLAATVKKVDFDATFAPLAAAEIVPNSITLEIQGIATCIDQIYPLAENTTPPLRIIIDIKNNYTQLIFTIGNTLKAAKNISLGKFFLYPNNIKKTNPSIDAAAPEDVVEKVTEPEEQKHEINTQNMAFLLDKINFTCDAISFKYCTPETPQILFFLNAPCAQENLQKMLEGKTDRIIELFSPEKADLCTTITREKNCKNIEWESFCGTIGSAALLQTENYINLPAEAAQEGMFSTIKKNVFVAGLILTGIIGTVTFVGYKQLSTLSKVLEIAENTQLTKLRDKFPEQLQGQRKITLKRAISQIEDYVKEQQIFWNMFGAKSLNPLEVLYELTELIDRRLFTADINHVTIALSDDDHTPRISVEGTFMSKTDAHYSDFGLLEKHLAMSKKLMLIKDIESSFDDNAQAVKFIARFKLRDQ